ncbi:hypothetical protein MNB_SV-5-794 [hydrothermal vent metagenome]|uniref:Uncharacterized protein n=1 Tax=hydrothermal vent metagenome TaxID=652676 RepID=A0A1W1ECJ4_9ZZZZ
MAMVGGFILNLSGKIVQETSVQYRKEQAILYAKSYTELAIMAATSQNCVKKISGDIGPSQDDVLEGQGYHAEVYIQYVGSYNNCTTSTIKYTNSQHNILLIDTYIRYRDPDHPNSLTTIPWSLNPGYTFHRRTIQKL